MTQSGSRPGQHSILVFSLPLQLAILQWFGEKLPPFWLVITLHAPQTLRNYPQLPECQSGRQDTMYYTPSEYKYAVNL